jgi:hypothetical protein
MSRSETLIIVACDRSTGGPEVEPHSLASGASRAVSVADIPKPQQRPILQRISLILESNAVKF